MADYWKDLGFRLKQSKRLRFNYIMDKINSISSSDVTELENDISTLQSDYTSLEERVSALENAEN